VMMEVSVSRCGSGLNYLEAVMMEVSVSLCPRGMN
jgi:hypothetical protein